GRGSAYWYRGGGDRRERTCSGTGFYEFDVKALLCDLVRLVGGGGGRVGDADADHHHGERRQGRGLGANAVGGEAENEQGSQSEPGDCVFHGFTPSQGWGAAVWVIQHSCHARCRFAKPATHPER